MTINYEHFMSTLYIALDAVKNGDIDEAQIMREWDEDDQHEGFQIILSRDVMAREDSARMDEAMEASLAEVRERVMRQVREDG